MTDDLSRQADRHGAHWDQVYAGNRENQVSWYQEEPVTSLALIREAEPDSGARVIDVGGGASVLIDRLLELGYRRPAVLDVSSEGLDRARRRLGEAANLVEWITADVTEPLDIGTFDVWHDRATFHFLIEESDRRGYRANAERCLRSGGSLIMATFALDGPDHCSGLPVQRYDAAALAETLGGAFSLVRSLEENHETPTGSRQRFIYGLFRRT